MRVKVLGAAAGGGFPQWNCGCANCRRLRQGDFRGKARTQVQVAVSADDRRWILLNSSPDLRLQIESTPELQPRSLRHSPISAVILTSAELDHVLGLLSLREFQPLHIYATESTRRILTEDNSMFGALNRCAGQTRWTDIRPGSAIEILLADGTSSGICCQPFSIRGNYPSFVSAERAGGLDPGEAVLGLVLTTRGSGKFAYLPGVGDLEPPWRERLESCDLLFFDGTFWSDDELIRTRGEGRTAFEMGHMPLSGERGSLRQLAGLKHPRKVYLHINNTNPVLDEESSEYRQVREAGWELAYDGMELNL